jgi:hypothetical protein
MASNGAVTRRLLLVGLGEGGVEGAQLAGFEMYRRELARAGVQFRRVDLPTLITVERAIETSSEDAVLVMIRWNERPANVTAMFRRLADRPRRPKIVFLDHYAQTSTPFLDALPYVDVYAKRQILADRSIYARDLLGGFVFTDFFSRSRGFDLEGWHFGSRIPEGHAHKLIHAWNLGVYPRYRRMLRYTRPIPWALRSIDVHARLAIGKHSQGRWEWYSEYRTLARRAAETLAPRRRITDQDQIRRTAYFLELGRSKIAFSPFGWGEVCIRDFEAASLGALLVKPSMEHVVTSPNIYRAHETYVPVKWDLSDLGEVCDRYLDRPKEAARIAANARHALATYFDRGGFVRDVFRVLDAAGV